MPTTGWLRKINLLYAFVEGTHSCSGMSLISLPRALFLPLPFERDLLGMMEVLSERMNSIPDLSDQIHVFPLKTNIYKLQE